MEWSFTFVSPIAPSLRPIRHGIGHPSAGVHRENMVAIIHKWCGFFSSLFSLLPSQAGIRGTCWLSTAAQVDIFCSPHLFNDTQLYSGSLRGKKAALLQDPQRESLIYLNAWNWSWRLIWSSVCVAAPDLWPLCKGNGGTHKINHPPGDQ